MTSLFDFHLVLRMGLEPTRRNCQGILSPSCLPIPPSQRLKGLPIPTYKGISRNQPTITIRCLEIPFSGELLQMDFSILFIKKI